jgi:hypothetical protein
MNWGFSRSHVFRCETADHVRIIYFFIDFPFRDRLTFAMTLVTETVIRKSWEGPTFPEPMIYACKKRVSQAFALVARPLYSVKMDKRRSLHRFNIIPPKGFMKGKIVAALVPCVIPGREESPKEQQKLGWKIGNCSLLLGKSLAESEN